jgi:hypothetical protein
MGLILKILCEGVTSIQLGLGKYSKKRGRKENNRLEGNRHRNRKAVMK